MVSAGSGGFGPVRQGQGAVTTLTADDAEAIRREVPGIRYLSPGLNMRTQVVAAAGNWNTQIQGTGADLAAIRSWPTQFGSFFTEDDVSSRRDIWTTDVRFRWGRRGRKKTISIRYEAEHRASTTTNPNDIFHFGRTDRRRYAILGFRVEMKRGWFLTGQGLRESNRSKFPFVPGSTFQPDETTDFDERLYQLGFGYDFGVGGGQQAGPSAGGPPD